MIQEAIPPHIYVYSALADGRAPRMNSDTSFNLSRFLPSSGGWETMYENGPVLRTAATASLLGTHLYVCGGAVIGSTGLEDPANGMAQVDRFDLASLSSSQGWETLPPMTRARRHAVSGAVGGKLCVCGGADEDERCMDLAEFFDPTTQIWTALPSMRAARSCAVAAVLGGNFCVAGGHTRRLALNTVEMYNADTESWHDVAPMLTRRCSAAATTTKRKMFVLGGWSTEFRPQSTGEYFSL